MKKNSILKNVIIVSGIAILSKVIGFVREAIIGSFFGATSLTDAYFLARNIPGMIFPAICNSFSTAFLSMYVKEKSKQDKVGVDKFTSSIIIFLIILATILSTVAFIMMPKLVPIIASGFDDKTMQLAIKLSRITMGAFVLTMIQYILTTILNAEKKFIVPQLSTVVNNIFIIFSILFLGKKQSIEALTFSLVIGLILQNIVLWIFSKKEVSIKLYRKIDFKNIKMLIKLTLPILIGNSIVQINIIVDKMLASNMEVGAVSALSYSSSINSIVTSVIIVSLSTVLYPILTENISNKEYDEFNKNLIENIIILSIITVPISIITVLYGFDIVSVVYKRGSFNINATNLTATALTFYGLGYIFIGIREIIIRGFYALGNTKIPMYNGILAIGINILLSIILSRKMGFAGIALGSSVSAFISSMLMLRSIKKEIKGIINKSVKMTIIKVICSSIIMFIGTYALSSMLYEISSISRLIIATTLGFFMYILTLSLLKCKEVNQLIYIMKNLLKKKQLG